MHNISIDVHKTKVVLIGMSEYFHLPKIQPAISNLDDIFILFTNPQIIGIPENNILKLINKNNQEIFECIIDFFESFENSETKTLIFYYVGHGYRDLLSKELYLTGINSNPYSIKVSGIAYNDIKTKIENSFVQNRIVIIDSCHSGLATMNGQGDFYTEREMNIM